MTGRLNPVPLLFFGMQLFLQNWSTVQPSVLVNPGCLKQGTSAHVQCRYFQRAGDGFFCAFCPELLLQEGSVSLIRSASMLERSCIGNKCFSKGFYTAL